MTYLLKNCVLFDALHPGDALEILADGETILGGGLAGCECAVHLAREGKTVHLVELRGALAPDANVRHRPILLAELQKCGVAVHVNCAGKAVTPEGPLCEESGREALIPADTVICAAGQRARKSLVDELHRAAPFVRAIGDCTGPANITKAIYEGYHAALDIE